MKMKSILSVAVLTLAIGLTYTACGGGGGSDSIPGGSVKVVGRLIDLTTRAPICRGDSSSNCATDGGTAVADVRVGVRVGDEVKECDIADKNKTSTDATGSKDNLFNEAGYFSCDVGLANVYELRAAATGYASYGLVFSPATFDNNGGNAQAAAKIQDLGNIRLSKGVDVTVNVVDAQTGAAITGATVYAGLGIASTVADADTSTFNNSLGAFEIAVTDGDTTGAPPDLIADSGDTSAADGTVIITGLNALVDYDIIVPAFDSDADGIYDYTTAVFAMTGGFQGGAGVGAGVIGGTPTTLTIALNRVGRDDAIALAAISGMDGGGQITSWNDTDIGDAPGVTTTGNIVFVFTYPVSLVSGSLNLVTDETLGVTLDINDDADVVDVANVAATGTLSAGGTVLTIDPTPTQLTANSQVVIGGLVTASGEFGVGASPTNADNTTADLNTLLIGFITAAGGTNLNGSYYVQTDSWTATSVPTLDNYDGVADGTGNGAANCLFAEFPERVYGSATVNSLTTTAGGAVALTPSTTIDLTTGSAAGVCAGATTHVVNEGVNGGCADADDAKTAASAACTTTGTGTLKYRVPLGIGIADDVTGAINTVQGTMTATNYAGTTSTTSFSVAVE